MRFFLFALFGLCGFAAAAQPVSPFWTVDIRANIDYIYGDDDMLKQTAQGNYYIVFDSPDSTITVQGNAFQGNGGTYIIKVDSNGNVVWKNVFTGYEHQRPYNIAVDKHENLYITGILYDSAWYQTDTMRTKSPYDDGFLLKINSDGLLVHAMQLFTPEWWAQADHLAVDDSDNVFITGQFRGTLITNTNDTIASQDTIFPQSADFYLIKADSNLQSKWIRHFWNRWSWDDTHTESLILDANQNPILTSYAYTAAIYYSNTDSLVIWNPGDTTVYHVAMVRYSADGSQILKTLRAGTPGDVPLFTSSNRKGMNSLCGYGMAMQFDTVSNHSGSHGFIVGFTDSLTGLWLRNYKWDVYSTYTSETNVFATSNTGDTCVVSGDTTSINNNDANVGVLICYSLDGTYKWHFVLPGTGGYTSGLNGIVTRNNTISTLFGLGGTGEWNIGSQQYNGDGNYHLQLTKWELQSSGINQTPLLQFSLIVYPNPSTGAVHYKVTDFNTAQPLHIEVRNTIGQLVAQSAKPEGDFTLPPGIYFLTATTAHGNPVTQKVIVQ